MGHYHGNLLGLLLDVAKIIKSWGGGISINFQGGGLIPVLFPQ